MTEAELAMLVSAARKEGEVLTVWMVVTLLLGSMMLGMLFFRGKPAGLSCRLRWILATGCLLVVLLLTLYLVLTLLLVNAR